MTNHQALVLSKDTDGKISHQIKTIFANDLAVPNQVEDDVLVEVSYSTLNYKDGLVMQGIGNLVKNYPHIPGIDFSGTVIESNSKNYKPGDQVILTGWRVGEFYNGGLSSLARVSGSWLVPLPKGLSLLEAMTIGTAGLTAMLSIQLLEQQGLSPSTTKLPVLVTGASGGVGSVGVTLLHQLGYEVAAITSKSEGIGEKFLSQLGADHILPRSQFSELVKSPLEKEQWSAALDSVGGTMLGRILGQICYGGSVAAFGLAGGSNLTGSLIPFLLRGIRLIGVDSVVCPTETRLTCWNRLSQLMPKDHLQQIATIITLKEVPEYASQFLKSNIKGRVVVDLKA